MAEIAEPESAPALLTSFKGRDLSNRELGLAGNDREERSHLRRRWSARGIGNSFPTSGGTKFAANRKQFITRLKDLAMHALFAELIGTLLLVLLGNGVVANVVLAKTKGENGGLVTIALGWAMAVFIAVSCTASYSGAHLNPAVTLALAVAGKFPWEHVFGYMFAQMTGGMAGAILVWLIYRKHFESTPDPKRKLSAFCTGPAIRGLTGNLISETAATFVLVYGVLHMASPKVGLGAIDALPVSLLVLGIAVSLGGTTGFALSPARDLSPRIMHALLPIPGKGDSDWGYAWIPVVGPIMGGLLAALMYSYSL